MNEKDIRKLSRTDLLEILVKVGEENKELKKKCEALQLENAKNNVAGAGSLADAALQVNGVFEAAQAAAQQYLDTLRNLAEKQQNIYSQAEQESQEKAGRLLVETEKRCKKLENETKLYCAELVSKAKAEAQGHWDSLASKLDAYYEQHTGLKELVSLIVPIQNGKE